MKTVQSLIFLLLSPSIWAQTATTDDAPIPVREPRLGTLTYRVAFNVADREFLGVSTSTVAEEDGYWVATHELNSILVSTKDTVVLDKKTLHQRRRVLIKGAAEYSIEVAGNKAQGYVKKDGMETPITADLDGPLFAAGPGGARAIACLPLAEGYSATLRSFDLERQRLLVMDLKVTATETVQVPAGSFETFKVEVNSLDNSTKFTAWIAKDSRTPVKISLFLGSTLTMAELEADTTP